MNSVLYVKRFEPAVTVEAVEDVSLPDYLPEVRRVVGVQANTAIDGKYLSGEELEADGSVTYTVLYTGADGALAQVSQTTSYTGHIPLASGDDRFTPADIVLSAEVENANCRVTAPRKLTLSSRIRLSAMSQKPEDVSLRLNPPDEGPAAPENTVRRRAADVQTAFMTEVRHNGEVSGEIREREGMKLIYASGGLCFSDVHMGRDKQSSVVVKGDAYINALMRTAEGAYVVKGSRAPIEDEIKLGDNRSFRESEMVPTAFGKVVMIEIEGGENGCFGWKMEYDIDCDLMHKSEAEITMDAYLPDCEDQLETAELEVCSAAAAVNGRLTTSAVMNLRPDCAYVCAWGMGAADKAEIAKGRMVLGGSVKLNVVSVGGGEFFLDEVTIPLKYECEAMEGGDGGSLVGRMQVDVTEINARPEQNSSGGNMLNLTAELAITAAVLAGKKHKAAVSITPLTQVGRAANSSGRNSIRVYVPDQGESAWDVEKKFRLGREAKLEGRAYVV